MFDLIANIFGYILNFLYNLIQNYGIAIILFSVVLKIILSPLSIKQQKGIKKSAKIQEKLKTIQEKYRNNPQKLNEETINLYRNEKMSPFSGCLPSIVQLLIILSVFYLVRSPLTYMKKTDKELIDSYKEKIVAENVEGEENKKNSFYDEIKIIEKYGKEDEKININMEFLGLELSKIPQENLSDFKVYIIPAMYIISSFISMRLASAMTTKKKKEGEEESVEDQMQQMTKSMNWIMPIMTISIAFIAPLGMALYWFMSNILMIIERLILNIFFKKEDEKEELLELENLNKKENKEDEEEIDIEKEVKKLPAKKEKKNKNKKENK